MNTDYPQWLLDATPGAAEAVADIDSTTSAVAEAAREMSAARRVSSPLGHWIGSGPADRQYVKKDDVATEDYEAAMRRTREAEAAYQRADKARERATKRLTELMRASSAEDRRKLAARQALIQHEVVRAAWTLLQTAMVDRDRAVHYAGAPGAPWDVQVLNPRSKRTETEQFMGAYIDRLDRRALELVADGEDVPDYAAEAQKAIDAHNSCVAELTRQRSRREQRGQA
ncbi:hypothetical protein [Arthrobacter zhaoguopingii]|uniref:hypothetical protein n=1 Tax=Arthrobacter zhaoguopingii TaxID=2681491 RepID=UPI00135A5131|nr:hypothetical protein [Arthrobacter zhaoguopingii]